MTFTSDKYVKTGGHGHEDAASKFAYEGREEEVGISPLPGSKSDPFFEQDTNVVLKYFEVEAAQWGEEDYAWAPHYRDVYSTENFSRRVREQMDYYPGMHSGRGGQGRGEEDPFKTEAKRGGDRVINYWDNAMSSPETFMEGLKQRQANIDYKELFTEPSAKNVASAIAECIPCFDRLFDGAQLLPDGDILEIHLLNIKLRTDLLDKLRELFRNPGFNVNICDLLKLLSHLCPRDLLALLMLLSQYLAKLNLDFAFNLDLVIELIGPILSPFLDALSQWLDKWVQMIIAPIICVIDHINATLYIAQNFKLPASEASVNLDYSSGVAGPNVMKHLGSYSHAQSEGGINLGAVEGEYGEWYASGFHDNQVFNTPDEQMYNPDPPEVPQEEWDLAIAQIKDDWGVADYYTAMSAEERMATWDELKQKRWEEEHTLPPPLRQPNADGSRWSPDDIPLSEKKSTESDWEFGNVPPESQTRSKQADFYYIDGEAIIDPIIQMRNMVQGAIAYVQDWFKWVTQMIYDLLGTDFGWMKKKMDQTMLKSRLIQLIMMIKAILQAILKNGLECGVDTNFDPAQLDWILTNELNKNVGGYKFESRTDGTFELVYPPGVDSPTSPTKSEASTKDGSSTSDDKEVEELAQEIKEKTTQAAQKTTGSGIIVKDCLRSVSKEDVSKVRQWIADFARRSNAG